MKGIAMSAAELCNYLAKWWKEFGFIEMTVDTDGVCTMLKISGYTLGNTVELGQTANGLWDVITAEELYTVVVGQTNMELEELLTDLRDWHG